MAFFGVTTSFDLWHDRLGHASSPIVSRVLRSQHQPVKSSAPSTAVCEFCSTVKPSNCLSLPLLGCRLLLWSWCIRMSGPLHLALSMDVDIMLSLLMTLLGFVGCIPYLKSLMFFLLL